MANQHKKKSSASTITMITILVLFLAVGIYAIVAPLLSDKEDKAAAITYTGMPRIGSAQAPVKIMEFGDFNCPVCKQFHDVIYPQLKKEYIDTGKAQMYFTSLEFLGPNSEITSQAAESVYRQNPDAFWKFYDAVYSNQGKEDQNWATPDFIVSLIKQNIPEVNAEQVRKDLQNKTYAQQVRAHNQFAQKLGFNSVPTIFINGKMVENPFDYNDLKKLINDELNQK
ncbi:MULTISPECIES: thioredoxin domain-containing protein [Thermoactinomyces]|jgi:protein-disulfide isomerase|uniref:DsbA family protein n=1 Tax=Thermoactinomyces daqus TaxID=1329516 RepID=A0A7W2AJG6_9BACL|nr:MULTISPECIES: thioredoxin domain-containing protein [Thermoactinomyces]MBA4543749.1 DsbA family protein [Thermoactinomyces daqus]MBH8597530.1 DsbA family protein [Thermoactinomyces sp. CICC 10523]MBH8603871.1 DsbA family protein [Thermoactinomyces sp. CICC 10522]MBH8606596.1 DsbA family protein [Thermoactinomyces sp. CICC 10521]